MAKICYTLYKCNLLPRTWSIITHEQIKTLLESYNFNSFGHYCFTRFLVFLLGASTYNKVSPNIENLILEETVCRYPFLFYYATEKDAYYGPKELYGKIGEGRREWKEKGNILKML